MLDLIFKDVVASRWFLLIALPIYGAQLVGMSSTPPAYLFITLLFTGFAAFGPIAIEEVQGTEILWCSLPLSRRDVVLGRYATTLLGTVAGLAASWTFGRLATALSAEPPPSSLIGPGAYAATFLLLSIIAALFLPCYFRLGAGRGLFAFALISMSLVVAMGIGGSAVAVLVGGGRALADPGSIDPATVEAWIKQWSGVGSVVMTLVALVSITISAALSIRFYSTRDC